MLEIEKSYSRSGRSMVGRHVRNDAFPKAALVILLSLLMAGEYDFAVSVAGGPQGWPVWVKQVEFDGTWAVGAGSLGGGFDQRPPGGKVSIIYPKQAPRSVYAQWFSYRTQTFYEVTFLLPEDLDDKLRKWYRDYPLEDYNHTLIVGFSGKGEALAWWKAFCSTCNYDDRSHDFHTPLIENVQAEVVEGDPSGYRLQTQELIDEGSMPSPW